MSTREAHWGNADCTLSADTVSDLYITPRSKKVCVEPAVYTLPGYARVVAVTSTHLDAQYSAYNARLIAKWANSGTEAIEGKGVHIWPVEPRYDILRLKGTWGTLDSCYRYTPKTVKCGDQVRVRARLVLDRICATDSKLSIQAVDICVVE